MAETKSVKSPSDIEVVKGKIEEYFSKMVELFSKEVNIANRYELKIRIETVQDLFKSVFGE